MKIFLQIGIIFGICWISELAQSLLPFAFPASVIAMMVLLLLLLTGAVRSDHIRETANFLLTNMAILFLPSLVGILEHIDLLQQYWVPLLLICVISTFLTFAATALSVRAVLALMERRKGRV